jgi:hypothetical protein
MPPARIRPIEPSNIPTDVPIGQLSLDRQNPRLVELAGQNATQDKLREVLWREMAVDEIAMSIATSGFHRYEPLFVAEENGELVVVEGNRRLAAVQILRSPTLQRSLRATDLPSISEERKQDLATLPVIKCRREDVWQYIGFKHVNGPQQWQPFAKAEYIAWVHEHTGTSLAEIARRIGDRNATVDRLYRGLVIIRQAIEEKVFSFANIYRRRFHFSHLYTGLDYTGKLNRFQRRN